MKFKVGDMIRGKEHNGYSKTNEDMLEGRVESVDDCGMRIKIIKHKNSGDVGDCYTVSNDERKFELINYTFEDFEKCPIGTKITFEKGKIFLKIKDTQDQFYGNNATRNYTDLTDFKDEYGNLGKIISVEIPEYTKIYRNEDVKEMTLKEVCDELGYEIKIIKED